MFITVKTAIEADLYKFLTFSTRFTTENPKYKNIWRFQTIPDEPEDLSDQLWKIKGFKPEKAKWKLGW